MASPSSLATKLKSLTSAFRYQPGDPRGALRFCIDLVRYCARELNRDQATQMAAALTYRTIFSLIPTVVLMLLVFRAFADFDQVGDQLQDQVYDYLGLSAIALPATAPAPEQALAEPLGDDQGKAAYTDSPQDADWGTESEAEVIARLDAGVTQIPIQTDPASPETGTSVEPAVGSASDDHVRANIQQTIDGLVQRVSNINFGSIGAVGVVLLIWAAIALVVTVERCFNHIYRCGVGRPWHLRVAIYWAVITLGPLLMLVSLDAAGAAVTWLQRIGKVGEGAAWWAGALSLMTSIAASWLGLMLLYVLMPNTKVRVRAALIGAGVAAVLWELGKWGFRLYVSRAVTYSVLYGTLGLIPLFLLLLYMGWWVLLFGLELSYTLQAMRWGGLELAGRPQPRAIRVGYRRLIAMMAAIAQRFGRGDASEPAELAAELALTPHEVADAALVLEQAGFVRQVPIESGDGVAYALARPAESIRVADLLAIARTSEKADLNGRLLPGDGYIDEIDKAQAIFAGKTTLDTITAKSGKDGQG